jgi:hypothetical protein
MIDPGAGEYWKKGDQDPDHGKPHRHTREKIRLLLDEYPPHDPLRAALWRLADKYPVEVLTALVADNDR